ncbi:MAG: MarR family transcriptional regulator [Candidatus Woesearchaeota archaeon]|nr:MarR family transcriptional regulator [Candidatus Woesearchaeota archaeon]
MMGGRLNNKKMGAVLLVLSVVLLGILLNLMGGFTAQARQLGCFDDPSCVRVESALSVSHLAFGVMGFIFALGFYLVVFARGEQAILQRLEEDKNKKLTEERFSLIARGLDEFEKKVIAAVREQDGITQNTLRLRTALSKAKLSYVLQDLEKKGLVTRVPEGKTLAVHLKFAA